MNNEEGGQDMSALVTEVMDAMRVLAKREGLVIIAILCDDSSPDCEEEKSSLKGMMISKVLGASYSPN